MHNSRHSTIICTPLFSSLSPTAYIPNSSISPRSRANTNRKFRTHRTSGAGHGSSLGGVSGKRRSTCYIVDVRLCFIELFIPRLVIPHFFHLLISSLLHCPSSSNLSYPLLSSPPYSPLILPTLYFRLPARSLSFLWVHY